MAALGEARPGYELWRPNREKAESKTTKAIIAVVLLISAGLLAIITLGGWERLQSPGVGVATILWAGLYVLFAFLALNWGRGILPVAASLAIIMVIFAAVAAPGWFDRAKDGLSSPALPEDLLGLLTIIVIPVQLLLVAVAMIGFNQEWHVEEERPLEGTHEADDYNDPPPTDDSVSYAESDETASDTVATTDEDEQPGRGEWSPPA